MSKINPKKGIIGGVFDDLFELGRSTVKEAGRQVNETFSPLKILENFNLSTDKSTADLNSKENKNNKPDNSHTPLNFEKLKEGYQKQDDQKLAILRKRLFQRVKEGDQNFFEQQKNQQEQQKAQEVQEKQAQRKKEEEFKNQQPIEIPQGKQRRNIFSPKKVAKRNLVETKAASGYQ